MLFRKKVPVCLMFLILVFLSGFVQSKEGPIEQKKAEIETIETGLSTLKDRREKLENEAGELAEIITCLKSEKERGLIEHFKLDGYLKHSQELAKEIELVDARIASREHAYTASMESLLELYQKEIDAVVVKMKVVSLKDDRDEGVSLLSTLVRLREEKRALRKKLGVEVIEVDDVFDVGIDSLDGPKEISEKADLMKDTEDRLRLTIALIGRRITELVAENDIREKVNQFLEETALFDEVDERLSGTSIQSRGPTIHPTDSEAGDWAFNADPIRATSQDIPFDIKSRDLWLDIEVRSSEDIELFLEHLRSERDRLTVEVEALSQKAERFYRKAEDLQSKTKR